MKIQSLITAASVAAITLASGGSAFAQAKPAAPAAAPAAQPAVAHGPALAGVCILSLDGR